MKGKIMSLFLALIVLIFSSPLEQLEEIQQANIQQGNVIITGEEFEAAPNGIYVKTYLLDTLSPAHWCWVKAQAVEDSGIIRWIHTSFWCQRNPQGEPIWPYYSNEGRFAAYDRRIFVPYGYEYYIYAFRWLPADESHAYYVELPVDEPWKPDWAEGYQFSPVYKTDRYHERIQIHVNCFLTQTVMW
ncbi:MAG: hypothetical protein ABIK77_01385 [candidate division WOR-3 bacterium]|uniref:Uncharacterized protein n=1 Tax=candidate division WOR-3 bacterium TaxID=2052148 RepID=A0A7V4FEA5_UNCW3